MAPIQLNAQTGAEKGERPPTSTDALEIDQADRGSPRCFRSCQVYHCVKSDCPFRRACVDSVSPWFP